MPGRHAFYSRMVLLVSGAVLCSHLLAKDFWIEKPFSKWTAKEAEKILNDSPWAESVVFSEPAPVISSTTPRSATMGDTGERVEVNRIFRVRFLSAKPVRMALSRWNWIAKEGDKREGVDPETQKFVDASFAEHIVISLETETNARRAGGDLVRVLLALTTERLRPGTFLQSPAGKKNYLSEYIPPSKDGLGAKLVFARNLDGAPFAPEQSGNLRFVTELSDRYRMNVQFKLEKMAFDGKLEF